ncbi:hypothetical protein L208DRAFT_1419722 [Tricholoma matsutake]|nr:hypothetical protein L208DRAFT_1419722 [Tricholoma matsutake 945]
MEMRSRKRQEQQAQPSTQHHRCEQLLTGWKEGCKDRDDHTTMTGHQHHSQDSNSKARMTNGKGMTRSSTEMTPPGRARPGAARKRCPGWQRRGQ